VHSRLGSRARMRPQDYLLGGVLAFAVGRCHDARRVSGPVFLLPVQVSVLHVPSPSLTPTNLLYNVLSTPTRAIQAYPAFLGGLERLELQCRLIRPARTAPGATPDLNLRSPELPPCDAGGRVAVGARRREVSVRGTNAGIHCVTPARRTCRPERSIRQALVEPGSAFRRVSRRCVYERSCCYPSLRPHAATVFVRQLAGSGSGPAVVTASAGGGSRSPMSRRNGGYWSVISAA
jgi:hypothetical protein